MYAFTSQLYAAENIRSLLYDHGEALSMKRGLFFFDELPELVYTDTISQSEADYTRFTLTYYTSIRRFRKFLEKEQTFYANEIYLNAPYSTDIKKVSIARKFEI